MRPQEFAQRLNLLYTGTMMQDIVMVHVGGGRASSRVEIQASPAAANRVVSCRSHYWHTTATAAAMWEINPDGAFRPELFPPSIQVSTNLIRNTDRGALTADAELVHRGKTTMVADVRVTDDRSRLIAKATVTMLIPRPPAR